MNLTCNVCSPSTVCSCRKSKTSLSNNAVQSNSSDKSLNGSQKYKKRTPDKKSQLRFQNAFNSPLQTIPEATKKSEVHWVSTPTRKSMAVASNPFEVEVDSLSMSSFSPSVFTVTRKKSQEGVAFRWSIEQLALLEPADIDETSQQNLWVDNEKETEAQKAIDAFFSKNHIAPSPWTPTVKYMAFTPRLASSSRRLPIDVRKIPQKNSSLEAALPAKEVATQTTLSIPPSLDLTALLGHFCTYHEDTPNVSPDQSSSDVDMLSTSSLRRKLFMTEDNRLESPSLIKEQNNCMPKKCMTPDLKSDLCPTPSSDHFSSSPITPRNWSLSMNHVSMSSPNISPICVLSKKSSSSDTCSKTSPEKVDFQEHKKIEKLSSTLKKPLPGDAENQPCLPLEMISEIQNESLCNTTWDMSRQDNVPQQESCDNQMFPNTYSESSSNQRDTGYFTGSLNSMGLQQTSSYMQLRTTPVTELLEDCAISKLPQLNCQHHCVISKCSECDKGFHDDNEEMIISMCQDQSSSSAMAFKSMPWSPNGFSTPSKNPQRLGLS